MVQNPQLIDGTYRPIREIGRGGTGVVILCYHERLQKYVVLKRIRDDFQGTLRPRAEADILKNLHHPYLPQVYDFVQRGREIYTVIDYIEGRDFGSLAAAGVRFSEAQLLRYLRQLLEVLAYLHKNGIVHSDLKPGNVILTPRGDICLIDFNVSLGSADIRAVTGYSPDYASPEQMELARAVRDGRRPTFSLDGRSDLYSLAATFYFLIAGAHPYAGCPRLQALGRLQTPGLAALLDRAMEPDRTRRWPSARKMLAALDHLRRQDAEYRRYLGLQALSLSLALILFAGGILCLLRGGQVRRLDDYRADYAVFTAALAGGGTDGIRRAAEQLLNDGADAAILAQNSGQRAAVFHALGDCAYGEGDDAAAQEQYGKAWSAAAPSDPDYGVCARDYAIALARCGRTALAQTVLEEAAQNGVSDATMVLAEAAVLQRGGDSEAALAKIDRLLAGCDGETARRACLLASEACGTDAVRAIAYLEKAPDGGSRFYLRKLAGRYLEAAGSASSEKNALLQKARAVYLRLAAMSDPADEDRLNLASVQRLLGQVAESRDTLQALRLDGGGGYRTDLYLALAYDALGDAENARTSAQTARREYEATPVSQREDEGSESVQALRALLKKLGVS